MKTGEARTAAATAAVIRRGDDTAAARLIAHGWRVFPPELAEAVDTAVRYAPNSVGPELRGYLSRLADLNADG